MNTWITSDLHLGHANIMKFCPNTRGQFRDISHMNAQMLRMWNDLIQPEDLVYILGDVAFMQPTEATKWLRSMSGNKILIEGNHDRKRLKDGVFPSCFQEIHKYLEIVYNGTMVILFHYPIAEWNQIHRGAVHFYGHLHQNLSGLEKYRARNVGFDTTGKIALLMEDAIADALKGEIKGHHV